MKTCSKCKESKPSDAFHRDKRNKSGLQDRCKECRRAGWSSEEGVAKRRRYYAENREHILQQASEYYARPDVKEYRREADAKWYQENRERKLKYAEGWRNSNPGYRAEYREQNLEMEKQYYRDNVHIWWESGYRKRAREYGLTPTIERFTRNDLIEAWGDACVDCCEEWTDIDHVIPVRFGGIHALHNCQPVCKPCNTKRWHNYQREAFDLMANIYSGEAA